jgi:hypothetical protein
MINFSNFDKIILIKNKDGTFSCDCILGLEDYEKEISFIYPRVVLSGIATVLIDDKECYGTYVIEDKEELNDYRI